MTAIEQRYSPLILDLPHGAVFAAGVQPLSVFLEPDGSDVGGVSVVRQDRLVVHVRAIDVEYVDEGISSGRQQAFVCIEEGGRRS